MNINIKLASIILAAGTLLFPMASHGVDSDSVRTSTKAFVNHSVITTKIKSELAEDKLSSLVRIRVATDKYGVVTLTGTAENQAAAAKAVAIAFAVEGVTSVDSRIKIKADK